jgi:hypothetical protein
MKKFILILISGIAFWGCQTSPPISPDTEITILGNDSTVAVKYSPALSAITKTALVEDFANVSCVPCASANKILESLIKNTFGYNSVVAIRYSANFPSPNDPFYLANPTVNSNRLSYYKVYTAPCSYVDGIVKTSPTDSDDVKTKITARAAIKANAKITVTDSISGDDYFVKYSIETNDTTSLDFSNLYCNVVVTEADIVYSSPPGANGETEFYDVMRVFVPNTNQTFQINAIQTASVYNVRQIKIKSEWIREKLHAIVFLQDKTTKEVYQTGSTFK